MLPPCSMAPLAVPDKKKEEKKLYNEEVLSLHK